MTSHGVLGFIYSNYDQSAKILNFGLIIKNVLWNNIKFNILLDLHLKYYTYQCKIDFDDYKYF